MSLLFFSSLAIAIVLSAPIMAQPITLGLVLLMLTLTAAVMVAYSMSSWLGYIVFIIYIGGVLVMFAYVAALTPNLMFSLKRPYLYAMATLTLFFMLSLSLPNKMINVNGALTTPHQMMEATGAVLFSSANMNILIALGGVLLLALIAVVKICHFQGGPLRPFS